MDTDPITGYVEVGFVDHKSAETPFNPIANWFQEMPQEKRSEFVAGLCETIDEYKEAFEKGLRHG